MESQATLLPKWMCQVRSKCRMASRLSGFRTRVAKFLLIESLAMLTFQELLSAARSLDASDRMRLANSIWDDVPPTDWPLPDAEWVAEAQRRSDAYDAGEMSAATWQEVRARVRREAGLDS